MALRAMSGRFLFVFAALSLAYSFKVPLASGRSTDFQNQGRRKTLVVYVFSDTDPEYYNNFMFFLREGMRLGPKEHIKDTNYIIIVQSADPDKEDLSRLPRLPSNAVYVVHKNECYDWGTYGWLLTAGLVDIDERYTHFIFINCSVRGPYMPLYSRGLTDWKSAFLDQLTDTVKLVGPVISCEAVHTPQGDAYNPHVQSYVVATDKVGLKILMDSKEVFQCHEKWEDAVLHAELASSKHILDAGFNIGALMLRYQGIDFRKESNWGCNTRSNPFKYNSYDGIDMNPYEVMFIKFKHSYVYMKNPTVAKAIQIEMALNATGEGPRALARTHMQEAHDFAGKQVCWSQMQGARDCFNAAAYRAKYPEYAKLSDESVWQQYVTTDQFTDREAR